MNQIDYDKSKFVSDGYGNLYPRAKQEKYKGFTIDKCIGRVKVWDIADTFFGEFPDVESAKYKIDNL